MTTAVATDTKARTPRKRARKLPEKLEPFNQAPALVVPECTTCRKVLDWRDVMYGKDSMCKRCYSRLERRRWRGNPVPAQQLPKPPMQYGVQKTKALTARPRKVKRQAPIPEPPKRHLTRAERRYKVRQQTKADAA